MGREDKKIQRQKTEGGGEEERNMRDERDKLTYLHTINGSITVQALK